MRGDMIDRAEVVSFNERAEVEEFARKAVEHFKAEPRHYSYSDGNDGSPWLALRWGDAMQAVLVCALDEGFAPLIFGDCVPPRAADAPRAFDQPRIPGIDHAAADAKRFGEGAGEVIDAEYREPPPFSFVYLSGEFWCNRATPGSRVHDHSPVGHPFLICETLGESAARWLADAICAKESSGQVPDPHTFAVATVRL